MLTVSSYGEKEPVTYGVRKYWVKSFSGRHLASYEVGFAAGKSDLEANSFAGLINLQAVERASRDDSWDAMHDGYRDGTRLRGNIQ